MYAFLSVNMYLICSLINKKKPGSEVYSASHNKYTARDTLEVWARTKKDQRVKKQYKEPVNLVPSFIIVCGGVDVKQQNQKYEDFTENEEGQNTNYII